MKRIPHQTIEKIKQIPMDRILPPPKRRGSNYEMFLCPLHTDRNPSLAWYKKNNTWWCYGCNKGGDIIQFVMELSSVSFQEAVDYLRKYL